MNKSNSLEDWQEAMKMRSIISFNGVYADKEDNIYFLHNSSSPLRKEGIDWENIIDGSRSDLVWDKYVNFESIPQLQTHPQVGLQAPIKIHSK